MPDGPFLVFGSVHIVSFYRSREFFKVQVLCSGDVLINEDSACSCV